MRACLTALVFLVVCHGSANGQSAPERPPRRATLAGGVGSSFGGTGVFGEWYVAQTRASVGLGVGYWAESTEGAPDGIAAAVAARAFTGGPTHRGFLELGFAQLDTDVVQVEPSTRQARLWGPEAQIGYQYVARSGLTLLLSLGAGYAVNDGVVASRWKPLFAAGAGITLPR